MKKKHPSAQSEMHRLLKQRKTNMKKAAAALKAADRVGVQLHVLYARSANHAYVGYGKAYPHLRRARR